jgi:cytoskeletal protein RodZ
VFQKIHKVLTDPRLTWVLIVMLVGLLWYSFRSPIKNNSPLSTPQESIKLPLTTSVTTAPRTSSTDNNVELTQKYTAKVNGETVTVPIVPSTNPSGVKGVITQEIDMTSIVKKATEAEVLKNKVNWEAGIGLGVHEGSFYVPVEIQRNYKKDRAIELELHVDPTLSHPKVNGGELLWKKLF